MESYVPPPTEDATAPATTYSYNLDRNLTSTSRPDSQVITRDYDPAGRLSHVVTPQGTLTYDYFPPTPEGETTPVGTAPGKLASIQGPMGVSLSFGYDGFLQTGVTWSGEVSGRMQSPRRMLPDMLLQQSGLRHGASL